MAGERRYFVYDSLIKEMKSKNFESYQITNHILSIDPTAIKEGLRRHVKKVYREYIVQIAEKEPPTPIELIREDIAKRAAQAKVRELESKYKALLDDYVESEKRFDTLVGIKEPVSFTKIETDLSSGKHTGVAVVQLSDWHFEERVDPLTINGMNEYNLEIANLRWNKCIQNTVKLLRKERGAITIDTMVLWLGGDFITGYIHEELEEGNYLSPTEATRFAKEKIIVAIKFLLEHGDLKKIVIPCNFGNHGRTNKKPRVSTGYKNSYEWMMFKDVEDYFKHESRVEFIIPNGLFAYIDIMGWVGRFWHGDSIKYQGGIGGLTIPLIKAIQRYDQQQKADYNFMGHYHQFWQATKNCIVNGSGIGFSAYAQRIGASPEDPVQAFSIIDQKYGLTIRCPIFCK
jgi:hypothetical protein